MFKINCLYTFNKANASWLHIYENTDLDDALWVGCSTVTWWNGCKDQFDNINGDHFTWFASKDGESLNFIQCKGVVVYQKTLKEYFKDWKVPSKQEQRLFKKSFGFKLPWSEENRYYGYGDVFYMESK